eukprot:scaffold96643_cov16-Prasinocladus_malaysianus.AAC.1
MGRSARPGDRQIGSVAQPNHLSPPPQTLGTPQCRRLLRLHGERTASSLQRALARPASGWRTSTAFTSTIRAGGASTIVAIRLVLDNLILKIEQSGASTIYMPRLMTMLLFLPDNGVNPVALWPLAADARKGLKNRQMVPQLADPRPPLLAPCGYEIVGAD